MTNRIMSPCDGTIKKGFPSTPCDPHAVILLWGKCFLLAAIILLATGFAQRTHAQSATVEGLVTSAQDENPLPSVNVQVKGTTTGTFTDSDGHYNLRVPSRQDTLVFSFVGYKKMVTPIDGRPVINVTMKTETFSGKELVVVGYGKQQRQDVNGSVSSIDAAEIANSQQTSVSSLLQGKAAGVSVTQNSGKPGGASSVRIRGITSITGNNEPLYVVDGVPVSGDANNTATSGRSVINNYAGSGGNGSNTVSPLAGINPDDIKNIDILKDASATAIYGSRGANGVVIITTKSGQAGESQISYNGYVAAQEPMKLLDMMNLRQYARLQNDLADIYPGVQPREEFSRPSLLGNGTDWQDQIYQHALMQKHQLSFSGGNDDIQYYISGGYTDQDGIVLASSLKEYTINANVDAQVTDWFKTGVRVNGSMSDQKIPLNGSYNGAVNVGLLQAPDLAVYNTDGTFAGPSAAQDPAGESRINPVARALSITNTLNRDKVLGNLYGIIDITKGLTFQSSFGGSFEVDKNNQFTPTYDFGRFTNTQATAYNGRQNFNYWDWKNYFTYKHTFADEHDVTLLLGQEAQKSTWEGVSAGGQGFVTNEIHTLNLAQPTGATISGFKGSYTMASYYTRLIYSFEGKYGLTATLRADGSSKFSEKNRWGYFPSLAASWKIYEEPFMDGFDNHISQLTLKAGYGVTGNQDIGNYLYSANLNPIPTGLGTAFSVGNISNPDLQWEEQKQLNLGISFNLFNDRLSTTVEVYNKISDNFLYQLPLPNYLTGGPTYQGGVAPPSVNLGKMQNRGIDVTLGFQTINSKDFSWNSKLTFSHYKNKVKELYNNTFNITENIDTGFIRAPITRTVAGKPIGLFYGYKVKGIFNDEQTIRDQPKQFGAGFNPPGADNAKAGDLWLGDLQYVDVNGDGVIDQDDRTFIGNPHPDFTFGFNNTFNYKNVSLSVFLQGSYGNKIFNYTGQQITALSRLYNNQLADASNYWTPENTDTNIPKPRRGDDNNNIKLSDRYVEDGSYIRVKNLKLGYTLPKEITQKFKISKLHIYGGVQNLFTLTGYSGYDPDVGAFNQNALRLGVDNGRYQEARIFTLGLNVDF